MGLVILLIVGGVIGWLASLIMRTDAQQGVFLNVVVGIVGAVLAGFLLTPLMGVPPITSGGYSIATILVSCDRQSRSAGQRTLNGNAGNRGGSGRSDFQCSGMPGLNRAACFSLLFSRGFQLSPMP